MILYIWIPLLALLMLYAVKARRNGMPGWEVVGRVILGGLLITLVIFGLLMWGFWDGH
jgi:RsiW-degrading membrane proteinase PrsW (M82 family)